MVPSYSLPNGSYDFPPGPDPRCRPVEAWAGFLQFCVCARMRAPYICDGGWNLKNKISQELVFLWLPPVSNQFLSLSHGFPMISDGFRWFPIDCYRFPMASYGFRNVFLWFPLDCYNSAVFLWIPISFPIFSSWIPLGCYGLPQSFLSVAIVLITYIYIYNLQGPASIQISCVGNRCKTCTCNPGRDPNSMKTMFLLNFGCQANYI